MPTANGSASSVAVVTGASRGLGEALAAGLVAAGWSVVVDARGAAALEAMAGRLAAGAARAGAGPRVVAVAGDVTDRGHRAELACAVDELGGTLDLLVNNASVLGPSPLLPLRQLPLSALRGIYEANVVAPLALVQVMAPRLGRAANPRVLNVTSDASVEAYEGWGGYGTSKAALDHLSAVLAAEEPSWRVWAVDPGDMRTEMHQAAFPGEDISDRPLPEAVVPSLLDLISSDRASGRYRAAEVVAS